MKVVKLMYSPQGLAARALAGLALIAGGVLTGGPGGLFSRWPAWCRSLRGRRAPASPRHCCEPHSAPADRRRP